MCLKQASDVKEVHSLMSLFLIVEIIFKSKLSIRGIFIRTNDGCNDDLRFLCIRLSTADDQLIEGLVDCIQSIVLWIESIDHGDNSNELFSK